jgi:hypothetical protein
VKIEYTAHVAMSFQGSFRDEAAMNETAEHDAKLIALMLSRPGVEVSIEGWTIYNFNGDIIVEHY